VASGFADGPIGGYGRPATEIIPRHIAIPLHRHLGSMVSKVAPWLPFAGTGLMRP
jgi:hypothetical protein